MDVRPRLLRLAALAFGLGISVRPPVEGQEPAPARPTAEAVDFFEKKIRPVLHAQCLPCHGPDKQKAGLRLDSRRAILRGGDSGPALVPGDPEKSLLLKAVRQTDPDLAMPPPKAGKLKLPESAAADLSRWIREGAAFPDPVQAPATAGHWAFEPVLRPAVPPGGKTPVDAFILAGLRSSGLSPAPPADRRTLIRRATYDLTGLPPSPEEVDAFLSDLSPEAFGKLVDRLLASPAYGEKWGRRWLDVARYADTAGENSDHPAPHAWRYRNYVIDAFNRDKPYDEFIREQIAGDLLAEGAAPERYAELIVATGYLATARRFGNEIDKDMHLTYEDVIDTLGKSVLGLTIGCARCHNHKYDPLTTRDYYALYGIFASTRFAYPGCEPTPLPRDLVPLVPPAEVRRRLEPWTQELARLDAQIGRFEKELAAARAAVEGPDLGAEARTLLPELKREREACASRKPAVEVAYAVTEGPSADARLQNRGEPELPGDPVPRRNLELLGGQAISNPRASGRLDLARWLTDPRNPLTARVMVNRIWQGHFGRGLVATPNDFGTRGSAPSEPRLLDYLASEFQACGWSVKSMHRQIMQSEAYQRSSLARPAPAVGTTGSQFDPAPPSASLARFAGRRLEAEELRDTLLLLGDELDRAPGGPHPFPPEATWKYTQHLPFKAVYDSPKRSVYLMTQRIQRHPFLALFDGPDTNASTPRRETSTVATQALYFLNDPFFHARSRAVAARLLATDGPARAAAAHRLCFQREASPEELRRSGSFLEAYRAALGPLPARERELSSWSAYVRTLLASNEFLYLD
jgi:hypothetical protein